MKTDVVVFLGPTLSTREAHSHLDARYLPPVGQGDVVRAAQEFSPRIIAVIDGAFAQRPAVRHKELLWAISSGIAVYGAASMGAIRAAELADFGMVGHGLIYRWYRQTPLADDADVAVAMAPPELGSAALSEALVDVRMMLKSAERSGLISHRTRGKLETVARELHFSERQLERILREARYIPDPISEREAELLLLFFNSVLSRQKKNDAISILEYLNGEGYNRTIRSGSSFTMTDAWLYDLEISGIKGFHGKLK